MESFINSIVNFFSHSPHLCLTTSAFITYIYNVQTAKQNWRISAKDAKKYKQFLLIKLLQYGILLELAIRALIFAFLMDDKNIEGHQPFNPLLVVLIKQFKFFNQSSIVCCSLLALFGIVFEYTVFFKLN